MCKRIYLGCCFLALLASCQKNVVDGDEPVEWSDEPIRFSFSIAGAGVTRAYDDKWETDDEIGVYMVPYVAASTQADFETYADAQNKLYKATGLSDEDRQAKLTADNEYLRYPSNGDGVSFVAYYPYLSNLHSDYENVYPVDVTDQTSPQAIDLLYSDTKGSGTSGTGDVGYTRVDNPITMAFKHQLTKLIIELNDETQTADYSGVGLKIGGIPTAADFDLSTAALSYLSGADVVIEPVRTQVEDYDIIWTSIVVPHLASAYQKRKLIFSLGGSEYSILLPKDVDFEAGKVYTFQCTFVSNEVVFEEDCTVSNWSAWEPTDNKEKLTAENVSPVNVTDVSDLTQVPDGLTNSYVVLPGGELGFPVSRAFVYESDDFTDKLRVDNQSYTGEFGVATVWEDGTIIRSLAVNGNGKDAVVSLYTHNAEGNAVVKIYKIGDTSKTAVWSWHIWMTSYDPTTDEGWNPADNGGTTTRNVSFMDRNLGATAAANSLAGRGLFYQWGRKDPFPANNVSGFGAAQGPATVVQAIQNPGAFYWINHNTNNNDWLASPRDDTLWGGDSGSKPKTIYDPCPAGWRVPLSGDGESSPWNGFEGKSFDSGDAAGLVLPFDNNEGAYTQSYWPAAGYRDRRSGGLSGSGTFGCYWSAVTSTNACYLEFGSNSNFLSSYGYRASGYSVRCVKE